MFDYDISVYYYDGRGDWESQKFQRQRRLL